MSMYELKQLAPVLIAAVTLVAAPVAAQQKDCGSARVCNPQAECLKRAEAALRGAALDAARKDCSRMPTTGTCYSPDLQSADCQDGKKPGDARRKK